MDADQPMLLRGTSSSTIQLQSIRQSLHAKQYYSTMRMCNNKMHTLIVRRHSCMGLPVPRRTVILSAPVVEFIRDGDTSYMDVILSLEFPNSARNPNIFVNGRFGIILHESW